MKRPPYSIKHRRAILNRWRANGYELTDALRTAIERTGQYRMAEFGDAVDDLKDAMKRELGRVFSAIGAAFRR